MRPNGGELNGAVAPAAARPGADAGAAPRPARRRGELALLCLAAALLGWAGHATTQGLLAARALLGELRELKAERDDDGRRLDDMRRLNAIRAAEELSRGSKHGE